MADGETLLEFCWARTVRASQTRPKAPLTFKIGKVLSDSCSEFEAVIKPCFSFSWKVFDTLPLDRGTGN
jgi:hypothetical protein